MSKQPFLLALILFIAATTVSAPNPWADLDEFSGKWKIIAQNEGRKMIGVFKVTNNKYEYRVDSYVENGTISIDTGSDPKNIDLKVTQGPNKNKITRGIYKFDGSGLVLCVGKIGGNRPVEFKDDPSLNTILWTGVKQR